MPSFNKVILAGNLTRDPELRYTQAGVAVGKFSVAVNHTWKDERGEKHQDVTFVDCESWGGMAETISKYLKKGRPILVEGRLKLDQWEDDGEPRRAMKVVLSSFSFLDYGEAEEQNDSKPARK
jgi:single stranded DNA-binding protein (ssb)